MLIRSLIMSRRCCSHTPASSHLSQSWFALEEVRVLAALWRVELGVEEGAAVGDGFQGGGALVREGQTHKQLQQRHKTCTMSHHTVF